VDMSTPTRRSRSLCCARAASGYAAAAPASSDMNWRRLMRSPRAQGHTWVEAFYHISEALWVTANLPGNVRVKKAAPAVT